MPFKLSIEGTAEFGNGSDTLRIERKDGMLTVRVWNPGSNPDQHTADHAFRVNLRSLCEELGIVAGDVPADLGYRGE